MLEALVMNRKRGWSGGTTYQDFLVWIDQNKTNDGADNAYVPYVNGLTKVPMKIGSALGTMYGSSWGAVFTSDSQAARVIQHALPSYEDFIYQKNNSLIVALQVEIAGSLATSPLTRNSYSSSYWGAYSSIRIRKAIFKDQFSENMLETKPFEMLGPTLWIP